MELRLNVKEEFWKNFNLSVIIPFYKKMEEFRRVFPINRKYFERNGIEVVIVLDTPDEREELLSYIMQFPFINWRVIMNDKPHDWRNPAKPLNVGIRHATKKYIMICSPESEMLTDVIYILRKSFEDYSNYPHYAIGRVCFADEEQVTYKTYDFYRSIPFGSIMLERKHAEQIHGYDEMLFKWGGDDNNIRSRLDMIGVKELYLSEAMMIHRDFNNEEGKIRRGSPFSDTPNHVLRHFFFPGKAVANDENWGEDFDMVIYDWQDNKFAEKQLYDYIGENFIKCAIKENYSQTVYPVLLLVQSYNESKRITRFMEEVSAKIDGIILLDDASTDGTYDLAENNKIIIKVQKRRTQFNDLENRNVLLDLAAFVKYKIAIFLDVDELIDERFCDFRTYIYEDEIDAYLIPFIHLWDNEDTYNAQYPNSINGLCYRYKMFRNIGHTQISSKTGKLHFHQVPTFAKTGIADKLLVKHLGVLTRNDRKRKYEFYKKEDVEGCQTSYEHFGESVTPVLLEVNKISASKLYELSNHLIPHKPWMFV